MDTSKAGGNAEAVMSAGRALRFVIGSLVLAASMLGAIGILNFRVDPFQHYRLSSPEDVRFPRALQRYINPGLARNAQFDFVITGSSLMENYDLAEVAQLCNVTPVNLATSAMSAYEQRKILEVALRGRQLRQVVMTVDFNSFAPPIDASLPEITDPLPVYLYDDNPWNDFPYLLSGTVAMRSLSMIRNVPVGRYSTDTNRAWAWDHEVEFSRKRSLHGVDPADINRRFRQGPRTLEHMLASLEANIIPLISSHPNTRFTLVFPPYSILVWADFAQRDQVDVSLAFKRLLVQRLAALPNAEVLDFQVDEAITHNLDLYTDIYHFSPAINRRIMDSACRSDPLHRLSLPAIDVHEQKLRAQLRRLDLSEMFRSSPG